jgi:hypothetical protein
MERAVRANQGERRGSEADDPISPELVLVDPSLRSLVLNGDSRGTSPVSSPSSPTFASSETDERATELDFVRKSPVYSGWLRLALAALCGSIVTIGVVLAIAGFPFSSPGTESGRATRSEDGTTTSQSAQATAKAGDERERTGGAATTSTQPSSDGSPAETVPPVRRFAWAPVHGATGYEVATYKDDVPVFRARTKTPNIVIPERSPQKGSAPLLAPGTYQWYVWPVRNGQPDRVALVRSTLVIPAR